MVSNISNDFQDDSYDSTKQKLIATQSQLEKYRRLAQIMQEANFWDYAIYDETPGDDWVAIDRKDYEQILLTMYEFDQTNPWKQRIERRID